MSRNPQAEPADPGSLRSHVRRAPHLVLYWRGSEVRACNVATGVTISLDEPGLEILRRARRWSRPTQIVGECGGWQPEVVAATIARLLETTMLDATDRPTAPAQRSLANWGGWNPAASFFHMATKNASWRPQRRVPVPLAFADRTAPHVGRFPGRHTVDLPDFRTGGPLEATLLARRTWRRFGDTPLPLDRVSALLGLTFGIQHWMELDGERVPLRTSPSGGARHSLEAYVLTLRVESLEAGIYHYCPGRHALSRVGESIDRTTVASLFPHGSGFEHAAVLVFVTSVFGRVQRKYPGPRAYRTVLLEAGHFCQTFCLAATAAELAPFCTAAFADIAVERLLGVDGVSESVVYAMGVGKRPTDVGGWAPWADGSAAPDLTPPEYSARF